MWFSPLVRDNVAISLLKGQLNGGVVIKVKEEECFATQHCTEDGVRGSVLPSEANSVWVMSQRNLLDCVTFQVTDSQSTIIRAQGQQILHMVMKGQQYTMHSQKHQHFAEQGQSILCCPICQDMHA